MIHCHMVHRMMNHMVKQVGPRIRDNVLVDQYLANPDSRPQVSVTDRSGTVIASMGIELW